MALAVLCLVALTLAALPGASAAPFSEGPLVQVSGDSPIPAACIGDRPKRVEHVREVTTAPDQTTDPWESDVPGLDFSGSDHRCSLVS